MKRNIKDMKKLMIGGQALVKLGSSRTTKDTDYLVDDKTSTEPFIFDRENNIDYINANGNKFFAEIWKMEQNNEGELASPIALINLKAYSLVMHCRNFHFSKADDAEYDIKFLARTFNLSLKSVSILKKYTSSGEFSEIEKIFNNIRK